MILNNSQVLRIIDNNWIDEIFACLRDYFDDMGLYLFGNSFDYPVDNIELEDINEITLDNYDTEEELFGRKRIVGIMQAEVHLVGYAYWDKEYHSAGDIDEYIMIEFSFGIDRMNKYSDFKCKPVCPYSA